LTRDQVVSQEPARTSWLHFGFHSANRDLLIGLFALRNGLLAQAQLVTAFQAWTRRSAARIAFTIGLLPVAAQLLERAPGESPPIKANLPNGIALRSQRSCQRPERAPWSRLSARMLSCCAHAAPASMSSAVTAPWNRRPSAHRRTGLPRALDGHARSTTPGIQQILDEVEPSQLPPGYDRCDYMESAEKLQPTGTSVALRKCSTNSLNQEGHGTSNAK
jgi:hypothetical protein